MEAGWFETVVMGADLESRLCPFVAPLDCGTGALSQNLSSDMRFCNSSYMLVKTSNKFLDIQNMLHEM